MCYIDILNELSVPWGRRGGMSWSQTRGQGDTFGQDKVLFSVFTICCPGCILWLYCRVRFVLGGKSVLAVITDRIFILGWINPLRLLPFCVSNLCSFFYYSFLQVSWLCICSNRYLGRWVAITLLFQVPNQKKARTEYCTMQWNQNVYLENVKKKRLMLKFGSLLLATQV